MLKLKAGKTKRLFPWGLYLLRHRGGEQLLNDVGGNGQGSLLVECGENISEYYSVLKREKRQLPDHAFPHLEMLISRATQAWRDSGQRLVMKWHIWSEHFLDQMKWAGNASWTHNYADEGENFSTRVRGAWVSRQKFEENLLAKWYHEFLMDGCT